MKLMGIVCVIFMFSGCTWVKPEPNSHSITLLSEDDVVNCVKKGMTSVTTLGKILFIPRGKDKIYSELVTLAKNEAHILGGDAIVPMGEVVEASSKFVVYQCR